MGYVPQRRPGWVNPGDPVHDPYRRSALRKAIPYCLVFAAFMFAVYGCSDDDTLVCGAGTEPAWSYKYHDYRCCMTDGPDCREVNAEQGCIEAVCPPGVDDEGDDE